MAGARQVVDELTGLLRGRVAIGMVTSHNVDLPGLLAGFNQDHPAVEITLREGDSADLLDGLHSGSSTWRSSASDRTRRRGWRSR